MSRSTQGSKGNEGNEGSSTSGLPNDRAGAEGAHTKRVTPPRPDRFRHLLPQALVVACLAGGTCASLAADHDHATADASHTLNAVTTAHQQPVLPQQPEQGERLPRPLLLLGRYPAARPADPATPSGNPSAEESAPATEPGEPAATPSATGSAAPSATGSGTPSAAASQTAADTATAATAPAASAAPAVPAGAADAATAATPALPYHHAHHHKRRHIRHHHTPHWAIPNGRPAVPDLPGQVDGSAGIAGTGAHHLDWHGLAHCEAGNRPDAVDPSGVYGGLYQFDARTWHSVGGHGLPQDAPAAEQTRRAMRLYSRRGAEPWPVCGPRLYR